MRTGLNGLIGVNRALQTIKLYSVDRRSRMQVPVPKHFSGVQSWHWALGCLRIRGSRRKSAREWNHFSRAQLLSSRHALAPNIFFEVGDGRLQRDFCRLGRAIEMSNPSGRVSNKDVAKGGGGRTGCAPPLAVVGPPRATGPRGPHNCLRPAGRWLTGAHFL